MIRTNNRWMMTMITKNHNHHNRRRPFILTTTISSSLSYVSRGEPVAISRKIVRRKYSTTPIKHNTNTTTNWKMDPLTGHITNQYNPDVRYQLIVGLEIHAQLNSNTKLFSSSYTGMSINDNNVSDANHQHQQQSIPNNYTHNYVNMYDIAIPGTLPVLSSPECIQKAILAAAAFQCDIQNISRFERKHYMYADIPLGYQLTQQRWPIAKNGIIQYELNDNNTKNTTKNNKKQSTKQMKKEQQQQELDEETLFNCRINRIQLEQDTGKTTTVIDSNGMLYSNVDYNRAGIGLIEIVTEPDIYSVIHTISCIQTIRHILKHCNVCDCKMELGQFRVDANVNIKQIISNNNNESSRIEIKNLNSIQQIQNSIIYEAIRHAILLTSYTINNNDNNIVKDYDDEYHHKNLIMNEETRTWNVLLNQTELIRRKDGSEDYRFLPDPDLPPILLNNTNNSMKYNQLLFNGCNNVTEYIKQYLPELPHSTIQRFLKQYQLSEYQAKVIVTDPISIYMMDRAMKEFQMMLDNNNKQQQQQQLYVGAKTIANLLTNELLALVKTYVMDILKLDEQDVSMLYSSITAKQLAIISYMLLIDECITKTMAKQLLSILFHQQIQQQDVRTPNKNDNNIELDPYQVAIENQLQLIKDINIIRSTCHDIIQTHQDEVCIYQKGNRNSERILKVFIGKAMIALHNNVHPQRLQEILKQLLDNHEIII